MYKDDRAKRREVQYRADQMERKLRQFQEASRRMGAKFEERIKQIEADFIQRNPHAHPAGFQARMYRQKKEFEAQMNGALLKMPPRQRDLMRLLLRQSAGPIIWQ